jgi:hypothetical protein
MADAPTPAEPAGSDLTSFPTEGLVELLQADRLWLLRQIDSGAWPDWRLDLAALERELGELLDRLGDAQAASVER